MQTSESERDSVKTAPPRTQHIVVSSPISSIASPIPGLGRKFFEKRKRKGKEKEKERKGKRKERIHFSSFTTQKRVHLQH